MRFDGEWFVCDDGIVRPVVRGEALAADGSWRSINFLCDTGADATVFSIHAWQALGSTSREPALEIAGVGGAVTTVEVGTQIRLTRDDGGKVLFRGQFSVCMDRESLDMSVLGRDILELFAVIVDRPSNVISLVGGKHTYQIRAQ
jgi:hypothetical protein